MARWKPNGFAFRWRRFLAVGLAAGGLTVPARAEIPLVDAARTLDRTAIVELIESGADANAAEADGTTALHWAAYHGDADLVGRLLEAGADAAAVNNYLSTPLSEAAAEADTDVIHMLLEAGADPNVRNLAGQTPLMVIARNTNVEALRLLLEARPVRPPCTGPPPRSGGPWCACWSSSAPTSTGRPARTIARGW
jgi:ankyrin repeat protein